MSSIITAWEQFRHCEGYVMALQRIDKKEMGVALRQAFEAGYVSGLAKDAMTTEGDRFVQASGRPERPPANDAKNALAGHAAHLQRKVGMVATLVGMLPTTMTHEQDEALMWFLKFAE